MPCSHTLTHSFSPLALVTRVWWQLQNPFHCNTTVGCLQRRQNAADLGHCLSLHGAQLYVCVDMCGHVCHHSCPPATADPICTMFQLQPDSKCRTLCGSQPWHLEPPSLEVQHRRLTLQSPFDPQLPPSCECTPTHAHCTVTNSKRGGRASLTQLPSL